MATQRPITSIRRGAVQAAIWENTSEKGSYYRVTFSRWYPGADGKPRNADNFGLRELAAVALLAIQAEDWIRTREKTSAGTTDAAGEVSDE